MITRVLRATAAAFSLFICLIALPAFAVDDLDAYKTAGVLNGRAWINFSSEDRAIFLMAYFEGAKSTYHSITVFSTDKQTPEFLAEHKQLVPTITKLTLRESAELLTTFYSDQANIRVPIFVAVSYINARLSGESPTELESRLARIRRFTDGL